MEKVKQIFNIIFLFTSKQNTNKKIPCCRRLCAFDRPEGDAQKGAKHAYYMGGGNLAYLFLPVSCKNKWAKLEWPYGFVKSQKVRWHLTVLWLRFFSADANELNRMANMPKANVRRKNKNSKT